MVRVTISAKQIFAHAIGPFCVAFYLTFLPPIEGVDQAVLTSYLAFDTDHNLAYPFFLSTLRALSLDASAAITLQVWLYSLSVFLISLNIHRMSTHISFGLIIALTLLLNPTALFPAMFISSSSFFIIMSLFMLGFGLSALARPHFSNLLGFGVFMGVCVTVEPFGWAYFALMVLMPLLFAHPVHCTRIKAYMIPLISAGAIVFVHSQLYKAVHDQAPPQPVASHLFAQASLMDSQQVLPYAEKDPRNAVWMKIENDLESLRQDIWDAPSFIVHKERFERAFVRIQEEFARDELTLAALDLDKTIADIKLDIALARIVHDPAAYLEVIVDQERFIWNLDESSPLYVHLLWTLSFLIIFAGIWAMLTRSLTNPLFAASFMCCLILHVLPFTTVFSGLGVADPLSALNLFLSTGLIFLLYSIYVTFINPIRTSV